MGKIVPCTLLEVQIYIKQKLKEYSPKKKNMRSTKQKSLASLMTKPRLVQTKQKGIDFMDRFVCKSLSNWTPVKDRVTCIPRKLAN